jgi:ferric enterobactin receptor
VKTDIYQWENVPKAVVEGLEGTLNVPVSETVNWTNNITYMLQSKNKRPAIVCRLFRNTP